MSWITLSPKAYRVWRELIATHFHGSGYSVAFMPPSAIKYREGKRSITLSTEPIEVKPGATGKGGWIFEVYLRRPLQWDNACDGQVTDLAQEQLILPRIEAALNAKVDRYEFVRQGD